MVRFLSCLLVVGALAGCGTSPQALGLTGKPPPTPPTQPDVLGAPGVPQSTSPFNSSTVPTTGSGRYYGY
jgi:hypothetical protein